MPPRRMPGAISVRRRRSFTLPKEPREVRWVLESELIADLRDAELRVGKQSLRIEQSTLPHDVPGGMAGGFAHDIVQVIRRDAEFARVIDEASIFAKMLFDRQLELPCELGCAGYRLGWTAGRK